MVAAASSLAGGLTVMRGIGPWIREVAVLLAIAGIPALALYRAAQEIGLLRGLWGEGVTVSGRSASAHQVIITAYPATSVGR
jgi:hypothetical protein